MQTCKINGIILYSDGNPVETGLIYAVPALSPAVTSSGFAVSPYPIQTTTTSSGYFELQLIQNVEFVVTINCIGFRQKIRVPQLTSCGLFSLSSLPINNEPSTPPGPDW